MFSDKSETKEVKWKYTCAFDLALKKQNLACRQAMTLMCLDSSSVFFMLSGLSPPQSTTVMHCNWTAQQGGRR